MARGGSAGWPETTSRCRRRGEEAAAGVGEDALDGEAPGGFGSWNSARGTRLLRRNRPWPPPSTAMSTVAGRRRFFRAAPSAFVEAEKKKKIGGRRQREKSRKEDGTRVRDAAG